MSVCAVSVYCLSVQSVRLLWEQHKDSGAFQAIVAQEFDRALATLSSEIMQNEAEVTICPPSPPPPRSAFPTHDTYVAWCIPGEAVAFPTSA